MTAPAASPWSPLRQATFRWLWLASIASNIGTWMHEVGAGWLMTSLSASPLNVALVQVAGSLPMFFLALPAGALADIVDKRRYLLGVQLWMALVATLLASLTLLQLTSVWLLLGLTLCMGIGTALMMPAWSATSRNWWARTNCRRRWRCPVSGSTWRGRSDRPSPGCW